MKPRSLTDLELEVMGAVDGGRDPWKEVGRPARRVSLARRRVTQALGRCVRKGFLDRGERAREPPYSLTAAGKVALRSALDPTEMAPEPKPEEFILRVCWSRAPDHRIRCNEVVADVGVPPPDPPPTDAEMQRVTFAAKMELLAVLRLRKKKRRDG